MSRAFTKEDDAEDDLPEKPVPAGPNYVTPRGLGLLKAAAADLVARWKSAEHDGGDRKPMERDLRYLEARITSAIVVPPGAGAEARFGARVTITEEAGAKRTFQIVGEDEARTDPSLLAWTAPLAQVILGAKAGDVVAWQGPDGAVRYTVMSVEFPK